MRLLKRLAERVLEFTRDLDEDAIPPYAILSHTWGADEAEGVALGGERRPPLGGCEEGIFAIEAGWEEEEGPRGRRRGGGCRARDGRRWQGGRRREGAGEMGGGQRSTSGTTAEASAIGASVGAGGACAGGTANGNRHALSMAPR